MAASKSARSCRLPAAGSSGIIVCAIDASSPMFILYDGGVDAGKGVNRLATRCAAGRGRAAAQPPASPAVRYPDVLDLRRVVQIGHALRHREREPVHGPPLLTRVAFRLPAEPRSIAALPAADPQYQWVAISAEIKVTTVAR